MWWLLGWGSGGVAWGGGGPTNVMVVYNVQVGDAENVAEQYALARDLPAGHLCGLEGISEAESAITLATYQDWVLAPLAECLASLPQPEDIDYLVVVRGLPYRVEVGEYTVSLSAALQVSSMPSEAGDGLLVEGGNPDGYAHIENPTYIAGSTADFELSNPYAAWYTSASGITRSRRQPEAFERSGIVEPYRDNVFIVTRLDGFDYQDALDLIERGVASDGTFPNAPLLCMHGADDARGARDPECAFAVEKLAELGREGLWIDAFDAALSGHEVAAYFTGAADLQGAIAGQSYVAGAITCNVTSYGAVPTNFVCDDSGEVCPEKEVQTSVARFVRAGATGAHGTVNEPYNNVFPNAGALLHYAMGYSLGESYFFNQRYLYWQNVVLGDPLATPYAERPTVSISDAVLAVGEPLTVTASHPHGIRAIRLYIDDVLVAEGEGAQLQWSVVGLLAGDSVTVRAVAESEDAQWSTPGWPQEETLVRDRTQGWVLSTLSITADPNDAQDTALTPPEEEEVSGCGGRAVWVWWGLLGIGLQMRRRGSIQQS